MKRLNITVTEKKNVQKRTTRPISSAATHRTLQRSTTLSRKYVKKPVSKIKVTAYNEKPAPKTTSKAAVKPEVHSNQASKPEKVAQKKPVGKKILPIQPKKNETTFESALKKTTAPRELKKSEKTLKKKHHSHRFLLAIICSAVTVGALALFVHFNIPDISIKVAAMQTGIEASYPSFVPRGYSLSNVSSEKDGLVTIFFTNSDGASFTLTEEKSTWDSTALLNNYVKKTFPSDYSTMREQGITIYTRGEDSAWVNGGILYKISCSGSALTKEQIRNIATSM